MGFRDAISIIGMGLSGMFTAYLLNGRTYDLYERNLNYGGLLSCRNADGKVFHLCGGHVFNSKNETVKKLFLDTFGEENFSECRRNSKILLGDKLVGYPIECNLYQLERSTAGKVIDELVENSGFDGRTYSNLEEFFLCKLGRTLLELYFKPYNEKIWGIEMKDIPVLRGKFPELDISDILKKNIFREDENQFVHSSFIYPKDGGSQFLLDNLNGKLAPRNVFMGKPVNNIDICRNGLCVNDVFYDSVVYCGDIRCLRTNDISLNSSLERTRRFRFHGTTSVFVKVPKNDYSWVYIPSGELRCHGLICNNNFIPYDDEFTYGTLEYTNDISLGEIMKDVENLPFDAEIIDMNRTECSYPVVDDYSIETMRYIENSLQEKNIFLCGRFANWKYFNMDNCIEQACKISNLIQTH